MTQPGAPQPKTNQRLLLRTAIGLLLLAGLIFGIRAWQDYAKDPDIGGANTVGMVAAIQFLDDGQQVVAIKEDGTVIPSAGYRAGATDRDLAWNPSGSRLYFVSDRKENRVNQETVTTFQIYRWNPERNNEPVLRSIGSRARSNPTFALDGDEGDAEGLVTSGGFVQIFNPREVTTRQLLPPVTGDVTQGQDGEGGAATTNQFSALYGELGQSFRVARWTKNKRFVVAIMRGERGEVLILQDLNSNEKGEMPRPVPVTAGERIDFDLDPRTGAVIYTVQKFRWPLRELVPPEFVKGNVITTPFRHVVGIVDPENTSNNGPIVASPNDKIAFGSPAVRPDGEQVVVSVGEFQNDALDPKGLVSFPVKVNGANEGAQIATGALFEPAWDARGERLIFARRNAAGDRELVVVDRTGGNEKVLTKSGSFGSPRFSPQLPSTGNP